MSRQLAGRGQDAQAIAELPWRVHQGQQTCLVDHLEGACFEWTEGLGLPVARAEVMARVGKRRHGATIHEAGQPVIVVEVRMRDDHIGDVCRVDVRPGQLVQQRGRMASGEGEIGKLIREFVRRRINQDRARGEGDVIAEHR